MSYINEPYQGWSNAQTWCVACFFDNTKELQDKALDACFGSMTDAVLGSNVLMTLAEKHQSEVVAFADWCWPNGFDLLDVDWTELSEHFNKKAKEIKNV